jgi:hypothetical protein
MDNKKQKTSLETKSTKLKEELNSMQSSFTGIIDKENSQIKKKYKCPELLRRKCKLNFDEDLPYHIKKKFTKNILLSEKDDKIVLISNNEYIKNNKETKEEKSSNKLPSVNTSKNKIKIDSKSHLQNNTNNEETKDNCNLKDILNEISEISADLELFEMEKRKRKMMKLIELMADKLDNNITNPNELINLFMLNKKNV